MKKGFWFLVLLACLMTPRLVTAADAPAIEDAPVAPAPPDVVTLKDGSVLYGEVVEMADGVLYIKTAAAADNLVKIKWANVEKLTINHPLPFHLKEGSVLIGKATEGPNGTINVQAESLKGTTEVPLDSITA